MNASCPAVWTTPSLRKRPFNRVKREIGASTITVKAGNMSASRDAARRPKSQSLVNRTIRSDVIERLVCDLRHRHRAHAEAVLERAEMIEDCTQESEVAVRLHAEIMRMPPQMKYRLSSRRRLHGRGDAREPQSLQPVVAERGAQEAAAWHVDEPVNDARIAIISAAERKEAVSQAEAATQQGLVVAAAGAMKPDSLVATEGPQADVAAHRQMRRTGLIARKDDTGKRETEPRGGGGAGFQIGPECRRV